MKGLRLSDVPMIVKIGFAPVIALVMFAVVVAGSIMSQSSESRELKQVVQSDMPASLRMQEISRRIAAAHGHRGGEVTGGNRDTDDLDPSRGGRQRGEDVTAMGRRFDGGGDDGVVGISS